MNNVPMKLNALLTNVLKSHKLVRLMIFVVLLHVGFRSNLCAQNQNFNAPYTTFQELAPGAVQPEGWLRVMLEKQASELGSKLPQVSWPFDGNYWNGEEKDESIKPGQSWFPWEQHAYWIDGAFRLALLLGNQELLDQALESINYTLTHADDDGYLGPNLIKNPEADCHRWPQVVFFRCLMAYADGALPINETIRKNTIEAMQKHFLNDSASYGTPQRNITNIEPILWCYGHTGDARLLTLAENAWREFVKVADDPERGDLAYHRVFAITPINAHGVTYTETIKLPAILYMYTGKMEYLKFAQAAERRIFDHHMLIDGIPSTSEWYRATSSLDMHETCDIADHTWSWGYELMATGDAEWADRIERACFNAAPGAIKKDWKALQYMSCPNQFLATLNSDHHTQGLGGFKMAFQPNPGKRIACCGGNVHRIFPNYAIRMWMQSKNNGLAAVLYGPSKLKAKVGEENVPIEIEQTTNYPFEEQINFKFQSSRAVNFPLSFRIPAWCQNPQITVNGKVWKELTINKGFVLLQQKFNPRDVITLTLPMKTAVTHWPQNGVGIEHGPLVYSLAIKADWTSLVEEKYSTKEYPSWEARPTSNWNYGLLVDKEHLDGIEFIQNQTNSNKDFDPWTNPQTMISVLAQKIDDWELLTNPENTDQKFTPPLPEISKSKINPNIERLILVPYGSTDLRLTIFPTLE